MRRRHFTYGDQDTGRVPGLVLSASAAEGLGATYDGEPARLAVILADGRLIDHQLLAREVMAVCANAYRNFLRGEGGAEPPLTLRAHGTGEGTAAAEATMKLDNQMKHAAQPNHGTRGRPAELSVVSLAGVAHTTTLPHCTCETRSP